MAACSSADSVSIGTGEILANGLTLASPFDSWKFKNLEEGAPDSLWHLAGFQSEWLKEEQRLEEMVGTIGDSYVMKKAVPTSFQPQPASQDLFLTGSLQDWWEGHHDRRLSSAEWASFVEILRPMISVSTFRDGRQWYAKVVCEDSGSWQKLLASKVVIRSHSLLDGPVQSVRFGTRIPLIQPDTGDIEFFFEWSFLFCLRRISLDSEVMRVLEMPRYLRYEVVKHDTGLSLNKFHHGEEYRIQLFSHGISVPPQVTLDEEDVVVLADAEGDVWEVIWTPDTYGLPGTTSVLEAIFEGGDSASIELPFTHRILDKLSRIERPVGMVTVGLVEKIVDSPTAMEHFATHGLETVLAEFLEPETEVSKHVWDVLSLVYPHSSHGKRMLDRLADDLLSSARAGWGAGRPVARKGVNQARVILDARLYPLAGIGLMTEEINRFAFRVELAERVLADFEEGWSDPAQLESARVLLAAENDGLPKQVELQFRNGVKMVFLKGKVKGEEVRYLSTTPVPIALLSSEMETAESSEPTFLTDCTWATAASHAQSFSCELPLEDDYADFEAEAECAEEWMGERLTNKPTSVVYRDYWVTTSRERRFSRAGLHNDQLGFRLVRSVSRR